MVAAPLPPLNAHRARGVFDPRQGSVGTPHHVRGPRRPPHAPGGRADGGRGEFSPLRHAAGQKAYASWRVCCAGGGPGALPPRPPLGGKWESSLPRGLLQVGHLGGGRLPPRIPRPAFPDGVPPGLPHPPHALHPKGGGGGSPRGAALVGEVADENVSGGDGGDGDGGNKRADVHVCVVFKQLSRAPTC